MAIYIAEALSERFSSTAGKMLTYFFCDSSIEERKTAASIIRGILYQLHQQHQWVMRKYLLPKYKEQGDRLFESFDALWAILIAALADENVGTIYCLIDALDECDAESQKALLGRLVETFQGKKGPANIRFLITSRPYPEIRQHLKGFPNKDLSSFPQAK